MLTMFALMGCGVGLSSIDTGKSMDDSEDSVEHVEAELTFVVEFHGDLSVWETVSLRCTGDAPSGEDDRVSYFNTLFGEQADGSGVAELYLRDPEDCLDPHFNVRSEDANNTDPEVLGIPGQELFLWVHDANADDWYPQTTDGEDFLEGGDMGEFDSISGWRYHHGDTTDADVTE